MTMPSMMRAMVLHAPGEALRAETRAVPRPGPEGVLLRVLACGICRTDLHVVDGELREPRLPLVPGHQIVGEVVARGARVAGFAAGERIGVPWLGGSCGDCDFCRAGEENLCDGAVYTGYQVDGGFAQYCVADARYCFAIPPGFDAVQAAPLLCAGLIGWRSLRLAGDDARVLGLYGFGAAAHLIAQVAVAQGRRVHACTRAGAVAAQQHARALGCVWAGDAEQAPPEPLDAAILFAPVGELVPLALRAVRKGGRVVCGGIHMSDIPSFPYALLWQERQLRSVANLTRADAQEFFAALQTLPPLRVRTTPYPLQAAQQAMDDLRAGRFQGAAVLLPD